MPRRLGRRLGSIRTRIVVGYVVLLAAALLITLIAVRAALNARLANDVDRQLADEVEQLEAVIREGDPDTDEMFRDAEALFDTHLRRVLPGEDAAFYALVENEPFLFSFGAPADLLVDDALVEEWAAVTTSEYSDVASDAGPARVLIVPVDLEENDGTFVAAAFTSSSRDELNDVFRIIAIVGVSVLFGSAVLAWALAERVVRPIRRFTDVTHSIDDTDLSARIPVEGDDEIAELSRTFNAMMTRIENAFTNQREFLDDVAHELRTPITIIQGHLDVLGDDPAERTHTVAVLTDELTRMNRYVDDLLVLAQAERPDFLRPRPVDLAGFTDSVVAKVRRLGDRHWVVDADGTSGPGAAVFDEQRIMQALLNLASNAVRHTDVGDEIGIGVAADPVAGIDVDVHGEVDGAIVLFWVRDTGTGVDPHVVDQLFTRHTQSAASRTDGGVGIGLSIVDAIASAHGGRVSVVTAANEGSTFTIEIPRAAPDEGGS
jgi:signal transduction histidine kinase